MKEDRFYLTCGRGVLSTTLIIPRPYLSNILAWKLYHISFLVYLNIKNIHKLYSSYFLHYLHESFLPVC
jgi:hypothetical protein